MPVDVAMEEPGSGVVSNESQSGGVHRQELYCITADRVRLSFLQRRVEGGIVRSVVSGMVDYLELVAVNMAI